MKTPLALASLAALVLSACGGNAVPTISSFSLALGAKDAAGNYVIDGKVTATDGDDGDRITRFEASGSGPAPVAVPSIQIPEGITVTDLPFKLALSASAPKGEYTFTLKAFDEAGEASAPSTAKVTIQ